MTASSPAQQNRALRSEDPPRYEREQRKTRSQLFVATTRARDASAHLLARQAQPVPAVAGPGLTSGRNL